MAAMPVARLPASLTETHEIVVRGPVTLLLRSDWREALPVEAMLDGAPITQWGEAVEHGLVGRGAVHVLATSRGEIVAKSYSRGGLLGAFMRHWYLDPERPLREAAVAEALTRLGCPTPPVVAARITRTAPGMVRLDIATGRVEGRDLLDVLREAMRGATRKLSAGSPGDHDASPSLERLAADAGCTLRRLHDVGLHHRDMQVKNLLVPPTATNAACATDVPLIVLDLDRCTLGEPPAHAQRVQSLARFARSMVKTGLLPGLRNPRPGAGSPRAVRAFVTAYGTLPDTRRAELLREVRKALAKSLRTHERLWTEPVADPSRP